MERWLGRHGEVIYALLRFMAGAMFVCHGAQKVLGWLGGKAVPPGPSLPFAAGVIELVAGALIAAGLFASFAAFIASGEMAVAYFMAHAPRGFWPIQNEGELAVLYCFVFLYIAARGSGSLSLDRSLRRGRR
jgi:putative oxidoreductase